MAEIGVASRITHGTLDSDVQVAGGDPVIVHGIIVSNSDDTNTFDVDFREGTGTTTLFKISVGTEDSITFETPFIADQGIQVESAGDADVSVTIFHSHPGR